MIRGEEAGPESVDADREDPEDVEIALRDGAVDAATKDVVDGATDEGPSRLASHIPETVDAT